MYSLYKERRLATSRSNKELAVRLEDNLKKRQKQKRMHLSQVSDSRVNEWVQNQVKPPLSQVLKEGTIALLNPALHKFRDEEPLPNVYVRNYKEEKKRVLESIIEHKEHFLANELYPKCSPNRSNDWLRETSEKAILGSRIIKNINHEPYKEDCYSLEPINAFALLSPSWRTVNKRIWTGKTDFARFAKRFQSNEAPWPSIRNHSEDKYIEGYEVLGDITRKRDKSKEPAEPFLPTDVKDTWNKTFYPQTSLRNFNSTQRFSSAFPENSITNAKVKLYPNSASDSINQSFRKSRESSKSSRLIRHKLNIS
ncbi:unnamed protein product [Blepharisma stoltei]|uniref:Uncharacterized protein n=1 Tax=Blepharisma stoltei TaxID=1481888 RepID=A0AAU9K1F6_9CILI|nr:unnamed protein product [Blepharisma stoltei]